MQKTTRRATPIAFVHAILLAYEKHGGNPATALRQAHIAPQQLADPAARITAHQLVTFASVAMRELDDEAPGWFSRRLPWGSYGMLARASLTAPNLGTALHRWCRHHGLLTDDVRLTLTADGDTAELRIHELRPLDPRLRDFCLLSLLRNLHGYACWAIDSSIPLLSADFPHPPPPHHDAYPPLFPGPIRFAAPAAALRFSAHYLALPLRRDEAAANAMLRNALAIMIWPYRRDRLLLHHIRALLPQHPTAETLADALHISTRTLHRQLKAEGTTLQAEKDRLRRELAARLLLRTARTVKQIAAETGFRNEKSFTRAFRQWHGQSPAEYRRQVQAGGGGWGMTKYAQSHYANPEQFPMPEKLFGASRSNSP